uniref:Uncharacterized protein n=1 Tax=Pipistrellus kuhlii TaxID=59472 RepID=A0A7J7ZKF7_PIPKU|nr:hypothetical protein mPipKuh1_009436 [Pipistrellus kuhlii]
MPASVLCCFRCNLYTSLCVCPSRQQGHLEKCLFGLGLGAVAPQEWGDESRPASSGPRQKALLPNSLWSALRNTSQAEHIPSASTARQIGVSGYGSFPLSGIRFGEIHFGLVSKLKSLLLLCTDFLTHPTAASRL